MHIYNVCLLVKKLKESFNLKERLNRKICLFYIKKKDKRLFKILNWHICLFYIKTWRKHLTLRLIKAAISLTQNISSVPWKWSTEYRLWIWFRNKKLTRQWASWRKREWDRREIRRKGRCGGTRERREAEKRPEIRWRNWESSTNCAGKRYNNLLSSFFFFFFFFFFCFWFCFCFCFLTDY